MIALLFLIGLIVVGLIFLVMLTKNYIYLFPLMPKTSILVFAASISVLFVFDHTVVQVLLFFSVSCIIMYFAAVKRQEAKNQP